MQVSNILKYAIEFVNLHSLLKTNLMDGIKTPTDCEKDNFETLINCVNIVFNLISSEYYKIYNTIELESNGEVEYGLICNLSLLNDIVKIEQNGVKVPFVCETKKIKTVKGKIKITYSSTPPPVSNSFDSVNFFYVKLNPRIVAYGVAAEYFYLNNLYDDATIWDNRFKSSMQNVLRKKSGVTIKGPEWI